MADKSTHIDKSLYFHSCDHPMGMEGYALNYLTKLQQLALNHHRAEVIRENQKYLHMNPEIRGVIHVIIKKLLLERPSHDIEGFISAYCNNHWQTITEEVEKYVISIGGKPVSTKNFRNEKRVTIQYESLSEASSLVTSVTSTEALDTIKDVLNEIVNKVHDQLQKKSSQKAPDANEITEKPEKSDKEDDLVYDLGLGFELDFSTYHEEDDNNNLGF